jgi:acid phosphatase type 7
MNTKHKIKRSFAKIKWNFTNNSFFQRKMFSAAILLMMLTVNVVPVTNASTSFSSYHRPDLQTNSTLTFTAEADAYVEELQPTTNNGNSDKLQVESAENRNTESYIRFTVNGILGTIQNARLRIFTTENSSSNGPAIYMANNSWDEAGITWDNRPARTGDVIDNKDAIDKNSWVEYDVTSIISSNGPLSFVLVGDSSDQIRFSSREGSNPPQLVIEIDSSTSTPDATATPLPTNTQPSSAIPSSSSVPGNTQSNSSVIASSLLTFRPVADTYIASGNPSANYGSVTKLQVDNSPVKHILLRFNVSGINNQPITSAKLRLYTVEGGDKGGDFYRVNNQTWQEGTVTWNNAPAAEGSRLATLGSVNTNRWYEVNITSLITGDGTYSLRISTTVVNGVDYSSREGANPPQLVITFGGTAVASATPVTTSSRTPTPASAATRTPTPSSAPGGSAVLVGAGDIASCSRSQDEATARLLDNISGTVFTTGDNVYPDGTSSEFTNCYGPTWGRHKTRTKPVPGNHDYHTSGAAGYFQYFNNIPAYYAYDLGSWRIYALNSEISISSSSAQVRWLQNDLAANPRQCVLAYWHKPRWSSGSRHGSNSALQTLWQVLYDADAELVINGHEHNYERFSEMNASGSAVSQGLREIVVGTGGAGLYSFGSPRAASQARNSSTFGVLKLTLRATSYDWQFIPVAGSSFTDSGSDTCH